MVFDVNETRRKNLQSLVSEYPSQKAFAKAVGKSHQQINGMLNGQKSFGSKIAREIEEVLGLDQGTLDTEPIKNHIKLNIDGGQPTQPDQWVTIPLLDVEASCGYGTNGGDASIVGGIDINPLFALSLPGVVSLGNLHVVNAHGDSMEPTICDKAFCFVDRSQTSVLSDGIFCLMSDSQLFIKRLQRNLDGSLLVISDNPLYKTQTLSKDLLEMTTIIGRVVYVYNGKPL